MQSPSKLRKPRQGRDPSRPHAPKEKKKVLENYRLSVRHIDGINVLFLMQRKKKLDANFTFKTALFPFNLATIRVVIWMLEKR